MLEEAIREAARHYVQGMGLPQTRVFKQRVEALQKALRELGVPAQLEKRGLEHTFTLLGCVFPEVTERFPQTYDFYRALAEEILGVEVELQRPKVEDPLQTCTLRFQAL